MKQLVILSGKGGTGKTSVTAAFAHLAAEGEHRFSTVIADADVDAANLELVTSPRILEKNDFKGGSGAVIDQDICTACGICKEVCRFDAIIDTNDQYAVDPVACEGCAACVYQCPADAIVMEEQMVGQWFRSESRFGPLFHAALRPSQDNSGKLVTVVKQHARLLAMDEDRQLVLVDGPPGIGCPVISAASGADLVLIVAEPTVSGIHDMDRVRRTVAHFNIPSLVCVNKSDIYPDGAREIEEYCHEHGISFTGHIPYDQAITEAMIQGEPVTVHAPDSAASQALHEIWSFVSEKIESLIK